ncbi:MAG: OmpA family protein [Deferrisomatales bacterium]|nr:OmpA family protein [Deferrisomatales bacterium]
MRRIGILLVTAAALAGCGVSKELYQGQVVRTQDLEARTADLQARLEAEAARRGEAEAGLSACRNENVRLQEDVRRAEGAGGQVSGELERCLDREAGLQADLDLQRRSRVAAEESFRGQLAQRDAQIEVLALEKERLEREKREKLDEIARTYDGLVEGMREEVERGRVTISQLKGQLSVNLLDEILFDSGSAAVKAEGREVLARVGEVLKGLEDKAIVIEGHTDDRRISGELARVFPTNWELSTARATSVVRYLQESAGIPPERLSAAGFGPYRPVGPNDTPEGRARNRRIEIQLVPLESPLLRRPED